MASPISAPNAAPGNGFQCFFGIAGSSSSGRRGRRQPAAATDRLAVADPPHDAAQAAAPRGRALARELGARDARDERGRHRRRVTAR